ncbi:MAG: hypothetical protein CMJ74_13500 [Planctomycetaceae bacterium]|nr:hypothetical protein [Planctomycetaceae bacterium]|tara:strand:- start:23028 stop:25430 length:2403 start_codon:yes stop_codon:yes gene_type:complete
MIRLNRILPKCLFALFALSATVARPVWAEVRAQQVRESIDRGIRFLKEKQSQKGTWTAHPNFKGGVTALCTLALLEAGVPKDHPTVQSGLSALRKFHSSGSRRTYSTALATMVFCRAANAADRPLIRKNVAWLENRQIENGKRKGGWGYETGGGDPSNSQFAILALYEASLAGFEVKQTTWKAAIEYWEKRQLNSGGWSYSGNVARGSMTCAGIASVVIAGRQIGGGGAKFINGECVCGNPPSETVVTAGLNWLGRNFSVRYNPIAGMNLMSRRSEKNLYYLYAMERVGRVTGQRFFYGPPKKNEDTRPKYDWYREGAAFLISIQQRNGSWVGGGIGESNPSVATSMALLFLAKGRRPVLISKLDRPGEDWNQAPENLTNLTQYVERKWKMPLTWQVINLEKATADDYAQTPVLFISGSDAFELKPQQRTAMRRYVERGGFIFIDGCCGDDGFDSSIRNELAEMFPESDYQLERLTAEHPIWSIDEKVDPQYLDQNGRWLWGINFACKTSVIYCPGNLSCFWELGGLSGTGIPGLGKSATAAQGEIDTCRALGVNVLAYATNKNLKPKDAIATDTLDRKRDDTQQRGHFAVAKLQHAGGCDVAPRAVTNLMEAINYSLGMQTSNETPLISLNNAALFDYQFVTMHGRHDFRFSAKEKRQLRLFVQRGGTILADAICGSPRFTQAFRREIRATFNQPLKKIPPDDPLFSVAYGGSDLKLVDRREASPNKRPAEGNAGWEIRIKKGPPQLDGIRIDGRWAVVYSPLDLSCALENHASPDCNGYSSEDAARIAINVILYSLHE